MVDQFDKPGGEELSGGEDGGGHLPDFRGGDEVWSEDGGEDSEGVLSEGFFGLGPESCAVEGKTDHFEVVVADGEHSHDGEEAADHAHFLLGAQSDGAMALKLEAGGEVVEALAAGLEGGGIDLVDDVYELAVEGYFGSVHL